jgi:hypothetical protein
LESLNRIGLVGKRLISFDKSGEVISTQIGVLISLT